jgi:S1-C subfamily serine protease
MPIPLLLEAQGLLESGRDLYGQLRPDLRTGLASLNREAVATLERLFPAAACLAASNETARLAAALDEAFQSEAARLLDPSPMPLHRLAPVHPPDAPPVRVGPLPLLDPTPTLWATPQPWGEACPPPVFAGWQLETNQALLARANSSLVRTDLLLDDAELSGECRLEGEGPLLLILRSDVVVKFLADPKPDKPGTVGVKFGFDNLRVSSLYRESDALVLNAWIPFRVRVEGDRLQVWLATNEAVNTLIAQDPRLSGSALPRAGRFGIGALNGQGAFRNVTLAALSPAGRRRLAGVPAAPAYQPFGQIMDLLHSPASNLLGLAHQKSEPYDPGAHPIVDGVLRLKAAPYVQFSHDAATGDHFCVRGSLRFRENGSVWLRVNPALLLGLRCGPGLTPFALKRNTGNFNRVDEEYPGDELHPDRDYAWELEVHETMTVLRLDGRTVATVFRKPGRAPEPPAANRFGISSYNTAVEVRQLLFQPLVPGGTGGEAEAVQVRRYYEQGLALAAEALRSLEQPDAPGQAKPAREILAGRRPPAIATAEELIAAADTLRHASDWPAALALLEANAARFEKDAPQRATAQSALDRARKDYEAALKNTGLGEVGPDHILRLGSKPGPLFPAWDGTNVWIAIPDRSELVLFDPASGTILRRLPLRLTPAWAIGRPDYALCGTTTDRRAIHKINLANGDVLQTLNLPEGDLLDLAPHPFLPQSYVSVHEPKPGQTLDAAAFRVFCLDETAMTAVPTDAIGMFLAVDPLGRYLFTGFHIPLAAAMGMDPAFLTLRPAFGQIDHLARFRLGRGGPVLDAQVPTPGLGGLGLALSPDGRQVCYIGRQGTLAGPGSRSTDAVAARSATAPVRRLGLYEAGAPPRLAAFHPYRPECWILAGNQVRIFATADFRLLGTRKLPAPVSTQTARDMCFSPDGACLLIVHAGPQAGVLLLRQPASDADTPVAAARLPVWMPAFTNTLNQAADRMADPARPEEAFALLRDVAETLPYSQPGEQAAAILAGLAPCTNWPAAIFPDLPPADTASPPPPPDLVAAATDSVIGDEAPAADPAYGDDTEFQERVDTLLSFRPLANEYPHAWLRQVAELRTRFPKSPLLTLEAARRFADLGQWPQAAGLAWETVTCAATNRAWAAAGYSLLARAWAAQGDRGREITALNRALALTPGAPFLAARLGAAWSASGRPDLALASKRLAWSLYPSLMGIAQDLAEAGDAAAAVPPVQSTADTFRKSFPAVVLVKQQDGTGTGFLVTRTGRFLTNHHVVEAATNLTVVWRDDENGEELTAPARVLAADPLADVALLAILAPGRAFTPLALADSDAVRTGDRVVAIGNPGFGARVLSHTATEGIVSGRNRRVGGRAFFQVSAAVNPGNSGGPLFNDRGQVIGMVTLKADLENVGFAVPANDLREFLARYLDR